MQTLDGSTNLNFTNQKEEEAFQQLKIRIEDKYGPKEANDFQLYRFLKARNFGVNQAEDMLTKHIDWKEKYHVDTILDTFKTLEVQRKYFQINILGCDLEGHPLLFLKIGSIDIKGLLKSAKPSYYMLYIACFLISCEKLLREQSEKLGKPIETWTAILDLENFPMSQAIHKPNIDFLLDAFALYDINFPERLKRCFVVNVSTPVFIVYSIVKRVISSVTLQKVTFYGKDGWKEDCLKYIDPDVLPGFLGGNRTDPDGNPLCFNTVHHGGIIPEEYYLKSAERKLPGQLGVKIYDLTRKGKAHILFDVSEPGSTVEWEFESQDNDIAFKLSYKRKLESRMKPITLIETQRVDAHVEMETGKFLCKKVGMYILTLDNSYSWFQQKKIYCRSSVVTPTEGFDNKGN